MKDVTDAVLRGLFGLAFAALSIAGQLALASAGVQSHLVLVYPAVLLATRLGGSTAGVLAVIGAALGLAYFVLPASGSLAVTAERDALDLVLFCAISLTLIAFLSRRNRALREATMSRASAEEAAAAKEAMITVVAHDLRNPLQTVSLNIELLSERATLDERMREALGRALRASERACRLVETIVERAHQVRGTFPLRKRWSPLSAIVEASVAPFEPLAAAREVALECPTHAELRGDLLCDEERIVQVLTNVIGNALRFTPRGGTIRVSVERARDRIDLVVSDTGCGMTDEEVAHAFERLWHGTRPGHGSGLGLWIAKTLVEAHGGHIGATSELGRGTTIRIDLPAPPEAEPALAPAAPVAAT